MNSCSIRELLRIGEAYEKVKKPTPPSYTIVKMERRKICKLKENRWIYESLLKLIRGLENLHKTFDRKFGMKRGIKDSDFEKWVRRKIMWDSSLYVMFSGEFDGKPDEKSNKVLGVCAICDSEYEDSFHITDLVIDKRNRGVGLGRSLIEYAMTDNKGLTPMISVSELNDVAKGLYEKLGFTPIYTSMVLKKSKRKELVESTVVYEPPWTLEQIKEKEPQWYEQLSKCPVHGWRAKTGIELIHKEPTFDEFKRIWRNWNLMTDEMKAVSDEKSKELFGMSNSEHYEKLLKEYEHTK